jgi:Zn-dependent protease with chaperone function
VEKNSESQFKQAVVPSKLSDAEYQARGISYMKLCAREGAAKSQSDSSDICGTATEVRYVRLASLLTALAGAVVLALIFIAKRVAGTDRDRLVLLFGPTVRTVIVILGVATVAQAGLFIYSAYTLEVSLIHRVHAILLFGIGLAALMGCGQLLRAGLGFFRSTPIQTRAIELSRTENPELFALVETAARKLGTQVPDHIVAGLEPNFFVTAGNVQLIGESPQLLQGRTLFVSLSLMRLFSKDELAAVVGHELGHFRGGDTAYSIKFAPIYARLTRALAHMQVEESHGSSALARLPALATLNVCLTEFAKSERAVSREREFVADKAGAEAATPEALTNALVKLSVHAGNWPLLTKKHIEILSEGRCFSDLPVTFREVCAQGYSELDWNSAKTALARYVQAHPVDTHPPMAQRLEALGNEISDIPATAARPAQDAAIQLVPHAERIEQQLTSLEIRWLAAIGAVRIPEQQAANAQI